MKKDNKIYYISYLDNWGSGINQKINMHIKYFKNHGYKVEYITLSKRISKLKKYLYKLIPFLSEYEYKKLNFSNNIVYIRYGKMDFR